MSFDLGDDVPLSITISDAAGQLANAGEVTLTITLPDGTVTTVDSIAPTSTGVYDHDYSTVQAGRHQARWVATGLNASTFRDAFDVSPADDGDFISLADAISHLKKKKKTTTPPDLDSDSDSEKLRFFISAACQMIKDRVGQVSPTTAVHNVTARRETIVLPLRPVVAITSVERLPGLAVIAPADEATGVDGWTLTSTEGVLTHTTSFGGRVRVTYRAGRNPIPAPIRMAALELVAHLWRTSQHNAGGGRPSLGGDELVVPGVTYALPYNVRQLLGLDKRPQDEVLIGS